MRRHTHIHAVLISHHLPFLIRAGSISAEQFKVAYHAHHLIAQGVRHHRAISQTAVIALHHLLICNNLIHHSRQLHQLILRLFQRFHLPRCIRICMCHKNTPIVSDRGIVAAF